MKEKWEKLKRLGEGMFTTAYLVRDKETKEKRVLLEKREDSPRPLKEQLKYQERQQKAEKVKQFALEGYSGKVFIPEIKGLDGENFRVTAYAGEPLTQEVYDKMSWEEKQAAAKEFALFLNHLHQKSLKEPKKAEALSTNHMKIGQIAPERWQTRNIKAFKGGIPEEDYQKLEQFEQDYKNRDKTGEFATLTHSDIHCGNVLYNPEDKRIALIDFEMADVSGFYEDMCCFYDEAELPPEFILNMMHYYNYAPKEVPVKMDIEKAKQFYKMSVAYRLNNWIVFGGWNPKETFEELKEIFQKIDAIKPVPEKCPALKRMKDRLRQGSVEK